MPKIWMFVIVGAMSLVVVQYLAVCIICKRHNKGKQAINEKLLELLKE